MSRQPPLVRYMRPGDSVQDRDGARRVHGKKKPAAGDATMAFTVDDVLVGCCAGFYGFNATADVVLPSYTEAMPKISAKITVNTIKNWSFDVRGSVVFADITFGVELELMSYDNIPIQNRLFVYFNSSTGPTLNIDGAGVVWLTGGGGGFDNLYHSIICADKLPTI